MPILSANSPESFAMTFSGTGSCVWAISYIAHRDETNAQTESVGCFQGVVTASGTIGLLSPLSAQPFSVPPPSTPQAVPYSRELQFASVRNLALTDQTVSLGKLVVLGTVTTFYPFSGAVLLHPQETATYVRGAGFSVFDSLGLPKSSSSHA